MKLAFSSYCEVDLSYSHPRKLSLNIPKEIGSPTFINMLESEQINQRGEKQVTEQLRHAGHPRRHPWPQ